MHLMIMGTQRLVMRAIKGAQNASQVLCEAAGDLLHVNSGTADSPLQMACYFGHVAAAACKAERTAHGAHESDIHEV